MFDPTLDTAPAPAPVPPGAVRFIDARTGAVVYRDPADLIPEPRPEDPPIRHPGQQEAQPTAPVEPQGLPAATKKVIVVTACANFTVLSVSGAWVLIAHGVNEMEPAMPAMIELLKWAAAILVGLGVLVAAVSARAKSGPLFHKETNNYTTTATGWFSRASNTVHRGK